MRLSFHSKGLLMFSLFSSLALLVTHGLGWSEYTRVLSGVSSDTGIHQIFGMVYILLHINFYFLVPILLIASLLYIILIKIRAN